MFWPERSAVLYEPSIDLTQGSDALGQKACLFRRTELGSGGTFARRLARMLLQSWTKDARCMRGLLFFKTNGWMHSVAVPKRIMHLNSRCVGLGCECPLVSGLSHATCNSPCLSQARALGEKSAARLMSAKGFCSATKRECDCRRTNVPCRCG